jgi:hypothetical protein
MDRPGGSVTGWMIRRARLQWQATMSLFERHGFKLYAVPFESR